MRSRTWVRGNARRGEDARRVRPDCAGDAAGVGPGRHAQPGRMSPARLSPVQARFATRQSSRAGSRAAALVGIPVPEPSPRIASSQPGGGPALHVAIHLQHGLRRHRMGGEAVVARGLRPARRRRAPPHGRGIDEQDAAAPLRSSACSTCSWKSVRHSTPGRPIASTASTNSGPSASSPRLGLPQPKTSTGAGRTGSIPSPRPARRDGRAYLPKATQSRLVLAVELRAHRHPPA